MKKIFLGLAFSLFILSCTQDENEFLNSTENNTQKNSVLKNKDSQSSKYIPGLISRYWNSSNNDFVYTTEPGTLPVDYVWQMFLGNPINGNATIRVWYNPSTGDRLLTVINEVDNDPSWVFQGNMGSASTIPLSNMHPIYRYRKYNGGRHLYTTNYNELGAGTSYWTYEGIAFYLMDN